MGGWIEAIDREIVDDLRPAGALDKPFISGVEECFVFLNRAPDSATELIPPQRCDTRSGLNDWSRIEEVCGIHRAIPKELICLTMKGVRPAFTDDRQHAAHRQAIFGAEGVGDDFKFPGPTEAQTRARY